MATAVTKAQAIRDYIASNKNATADQVVEALGEKGLKVTSQRVYDVKSKTNPKRKRATKVKGESGSDSPDSAYSRGKSRPYPQRTLEEALAVPKAIRDKNNGRPWSPDEVAKASGLSRVIGRFKTSHLWALVAGRVRDVDNRRIRCHRQSKRGAVQVWFCGSCEFCVCFRRLDPEGALAGFESSGMACAHDSTSPAAAV